MRESTPAKRAKVTNKIIGRDIKIEKSFILLLLKCAGFFGLTLFDFLAICTKFLAILETFLSEFGDLEVIYFLDGKNMSN